MTTRAGDCIGSVIGWPRSPAVAHCNLSRHDLRLMTRVGISCDVEVEGDFYLSWGRGRGECVHCN